MARAVHDQLCSRVSLLALLCCLVCTAAMQLPRRPIRPTSHRLVARVQSGVPSQGSTFGVTQKLVARPVVSATLAGSKTPASAMITADVPAGTPITGEFIVLFKPDVNDLEAAVADTQARAATVVAGAASPSSAAAPSSNTVTVLFTHPAPAEGIQSQAVIQVPANLNPEDVKAALTASPDVEAVVQNRVVKVTQAGGTCYPPYYAAGVQGNPISGITFSWANCLTDTTKLALFGERCGNNKGKFRWTGIYAYSPSTGQLYKNCVRLRSQESNAQRLAQFFGDCGVAPTYFASMPTSVCQEDEDTPCVDSAKISQYTVSLNTALCTGGHPSATFLGTACGPNNALVLWTQLAATGCAALSRAGLDLKQQADWLGQCGVSPQQIVGLPTRICGRVPGGFTNTPPPIAPAPQPAPAPANPPPLPPVGGRVSMPMTAMRPGENANWGVGRIGTYDANSKRVTDPSAAIASTGYKVAVIDTGSERSHPDLNVVEFVDFVDGQGTSYFGQDGNGHGTHVAGIISAKNNGAGIFGVVPGMPILALKVLPKEGSGPLDKVYKAYGEVLARLQKGEKIVSINLSLSSQSSDSTAKQVECDWVKKISAYGTAVVAAAGNDGEQLGYNLPAACPDAITVTSMESDDSPSSFGNYDYTNGNKRTTLIAAPGGQIYSTYMGGGYATLSGTSMATPFVTGAFAQCALVGRCRLSNGNTPAASTNYPVMTAAAQALACGDRGKCGPQWGSSNYYGYFLNVRQFGAKK